MSAPTVAITGLGLWTAGFPGAAAWAAGTHAPEAERPVGRALDRVNRRRASVLGRAVADAAAEAMEQAAVDPATIATVVGSSIGEASTMIGLLEQMWRLRTPMSPAAFTVSVHNAASGLLSISSKNRGYATSLAADHDTPAAALLEGVGLVSQRGTPVLVVCADEAAPASLVREVPLWDLLAAAVVLAPLESAPSARARLMLRADAVPDATPPDLAPGLANHPQVGLLDLVDAVVRGVTGTVALDRGRGTGWTATLSPR